MNASHRRPLAAYVLVTVAGSVVVAQGLFTAAVISPDTLLGRILGGYPGYDRLDASAPIDPAPAPEPVPTSPAPSGTGGSGAPGSPLDFLDSIDVSPVPPAGSYRRSAILSSGATTRLDWLSLPSW